MEEIGAAVLPDPAAIAAGPDDAPMASPATLELARTREGHSLTDTEDLGGLSAIDEAIQLVDSADEPWSVHLEARVAGVLDESRLRAAAAAAVALHPRARACRAERGGWRRRWAWEICPAPDPDALIQVVECPDDAALGTARAELQSRFIPLTGSPPLRLCLVHHPDGDVVMVNLNHGVGDGIAALRLLRSIARAYVGQRDAVVADPDLTATPFRPRSGPLTLAGELAELMARPDRVAPEGGHHAPGYGFHHVRLSVEATRAVIERRQRAATVNDLLVAALHLAIDSWNEEHGRRSQRIAVLMPVNLRTPQWWYEGVTNASFMVPVSTRARHRVDPPTVLARVTERTRRVKLGRTPAALVGLLAGLQRLPLPLKLLTARSLSRGRFVKTAILSNLGRLDDPPSFGPHGGDVVEMWFSPPAKMPLGVAIGALTLGGRLHLSFRYRHPLFGTAAAARFAERYVVALESLAAHPDPADATTAANRRRENHMWPRPCGRAGVRLETVGPGRRSGAPGAGPPWEGTPEHPRRIPYRSDVAPARFDTALDCSLAR